VLFTDKELPQPTNRRFYPTKKDNHTHIFRGKVKDRDLNQESGMPVDQPLSASETLNGSLDELPAEVVSDDANIIPDDTNAIPHARNVALSDADAGEKCGDLLEQLRQLTFVTQDEDVLARLKSSLQELLEEFKLFCARQNNESFENMSTMQRETLLTLVNGD